MLKIIFGAVIVYTIVILFGSNVYKKRVIDDYERRILRLYQEFVDDCIEVKNYLDMEERASREPKMRKELNNMIDKYSAYYRRERSKNYETLLEESAEEYIKKN